MAIMRLKALYDGYAFIPELPIELPKDTAVEIEIDVPDPQNAESGRAAISRAVAAAERADKATRVLPRPDLPVQSSIAKHSSDEVSAPGNG